MEKEKYYLDVINKANDLEDALDLLERRPSIHARQDVLKKRKLLKSAIHFAITMNAQVVKPKFVRNNQVKQFQIFLAK